MCIIYYTQIMIQYNLFILKLITIRANILKQTPLTVIYK